VTVVTWFLAGGAFGPVSCALATCRAAAWAVATIARWKYQRGAAPRTGHPETLEKPLWAKCGQ
jgi:hypothetical protein